MSITVKNLVPGTQLTGSTATYYTATNVKAILDKVTLCNTTAGAITVEMWLVPTGGTAGDSNKVLDAISVAAHTMYTYPEIVGHVLAAGDTLQAKASAATSVSLRVSGREVS